MEKRFDTNIRAAVAVAEEGRMGGEGRGRESFDCLSDFEDSLISSHLM